MSSSRRAPTSTRDFARTAVHVAKLILALALLVVAVRPPAQSLAFQTAPLVRKDRSEQVDAVARVGRDPGRLPALRPARSGDPPALGRARGLWFAGLAVAVPSVAPATERGLLDARTVAQRTWTPAAKTRADLMVFLN